MIDWEWYSDLSVKAVFIHLLLVANSEDKNWRGIKIERGEHLTSWRKLSNDVCLAMSTVQEAIKKLKSTEDVSYRSTSGYTIFKITHYDDYQEKKSVPNKGTLSGTIAGTDSGTLSGTKQEVKNQEERNKEESRINNTVHSVECSPSQPSLEDIKIYIKERKYSVDPEAFFAYYEANGWMIGKRKMVKWKAAITSWQKKMESKTTPTKCVDRTRLYTYDEVLNLVQTSGYKFSDFEIANKEKGLRKLKQ